MDQNISREENRTTLTMDLWEIPPQLKYNSSQTKSPHIGATILIVEDHMINARINHSIETMKNGFEPDLSTIRMETEEPLEKFLVLHRLTGETSHKKNHIDNRKVIKLTILLSADLTIDPRLVSHLTNKNFHSKIIRRHPMWFASSQPTISLMNYQTLSVKLLRSPNANSDKCPFSRLSLNIFYLATGDTQKDNGLGIEFMLDRGAFCSIIKYRILLEIFQLQHPKVIQKVTK